ncbi:MAG TPA: tetratricopeptide repeat protein [Myxococcota bacterium]
MAANKRKILEAARKYAQKGAKDRALKEYEQLLRLDPKDAKLRLEIGDAYRRWGQVDEAISAYTKVADQYTKEGFDARAVAVFKQIQNLAPESFDSFVPLAELYQRMGLTAEAIAALQTAADGYHRQGKKREALELLRKMATLDPTNTGSRLKVADLLRQEKLFAEAIDEYEQVAAELQRQGVIEAVGTVLERILELDPNRPATVRLLAQNLLARGLGERAEPYAKRLLDAGPEGTENYELLADVYRAQKREDALVDIYRRLADLYRRRGDEENARQILQRFVPPDALADTMQQEVLLADESAPADEKSLIDEEFLDDGFSEDLLEESAEPAPPVKGPARSVAEETVLVPRGGVRRAEAAESGPTGDTEQLFAEASVYLRYGKRAQAIENLHAILVQNPRHRAALEKLGDAHADAREPQEAVEAWLRAAELAREESDLTALAVLRDRISALDDQAGAEVAGWLPAGAEAPEPEIELVEPDEELLAPAAAEAPADEEAEESGEQEFDLGDIEIEVDADEPDPAAETEHSARPVAVREKAEPAAPKSPAPGDSASASQQISEDLEEADFYFQQGLHGEAEAIYQRVLALAPNHPLALVRMGEIAAAQGSDPGSTSGGHPAAAAEPEADEAASASDSSEIGRDLADWSDDIAGEPAASVASAADSGSDLEIEIDDEPAVESAAAEDSTDEVAAPVAVAPEPAAPEEDLSLDDEAEQDALDPDADTAADQGASAPTAPLSAEGEASFDLAAELSEAFGDDKDGSSGGAAGAADDGFASVFGEFKKGVSRMLSEGDHEAHYDLGIAYREMGLLGDAVSEFRAAMGSPARKIDCLHMLGLCTLEQGGASDAARFFEQALAAPDSTPEQQLAVRFELGRAFDALGDRVRARAAFEAVAAVDPGFCDVEEWLERTDENAKPESQAAGAGFESFEDLIGEDADAPEAVEAGNESFDDVIAEANEEEAEPEEPETDEPVAAPPPRKAATRGKAPAAKPARKKKISFV